MYDLENIFKNYNPGVIGPEKILFSSIVVPVINIDGEQHVIFEVRSKRLKSQPGEVSFPGGKVDENESPLNAARREFSEELDAAQEKIEIISELDIYFAASRGLIFCYLGVVDESINLNVRNSEVEELFTVPLKFFIETEPEVYTNSIRVFPDENFPYEKMKISETYNWGIQNYPVLFYNYGGHIIWGITANIINNFAKKIKDKL
ncbi:NUDIX hydrolase [Peptostreptococcus faecalis]|uniref:NUDIX hydrolase n=1 Tax=Peptostreptococcus faecalis TaxID=2045015 RepID=UPI000C7B5DAE|nr:CoA pyrophosphatase [Peptostreptococcus faecalis]